MVPQMRINYSRVISQARDIGGLAGNMKSESRTLQQEMSQASSRWNGEAAAEFLKKCRILEEDLKETAADLEQLADRITRTAYEIQREDERAVREYKDKLAQQNNRG